MRNILIALCLILALMFASAPGAAQSKTMYKWVPLGQVFVTGYVERGWTASGVWSGPGQCAIDPNWIRMGSFIKVAGLWTCKATDTGGLVIGAHVDMWVSTDSEANAITGYRQAWKRVRR